jgi:transposase
VVHPLAVAQQLAEPVHDATPRTAPADAPLGPAGHRPGAALAGGLPGLLRPGPQLCTEYLRRWCYGAKRSRLQPVKEFVTLVENHWDGIIAWHKNHLSNGLLEGINSLVQAAKARARGYRSKTKMITIVSLTAAKLQLPTLTHPTPAYMLSR